MFVCQTSAYLLIYLISGLKHESNTGFGMCHVVVKLLMFVDYDN